MEEGLSIMTNVYDFDGKRVTHASLVEVLEERGYTVTPPEQNRISVEEFLRARLDLDNPFLEFGGRLVQRYRDAVAYVAADYADYAAAAVAAAAYAAYVAYDAALQDFMHTWSDHPDFLLIDLSLLEPR
jgi:hypothetical protein